MRRHEVAGGWYGECLPDGSWACTMLDQGISSSEGPIDIPDKDQLLFLRAWRAPESIQVLGQSHLTGRLLRAVPGASWADLGPTCGVSPALFLPNGSILVNRDCKDGSQGYRFIDELGQVHTGDATYTHPSGLVDEWTSLGGLVIGQGSTGGAVVLFDKGAHLIEPGDCRAIRVQYDPANNLYAIAIVKQVEHKTVFIWIGRNELLSLPPVTIPDVPPQPPVEPPVTPSPKEPPTMPDRPNRLDVVQKVRDRYPTPLGAFHPEFLLTLAWTLGSDAGLLRKGTGTVITLPDGTTVAQDIICYPEGVLFDVLGDGEGAAKPTWDGPKPVDAARYYRVMETVPPVIPPPPHQPPPPVPTVDPVIETLEAKVDYLVMAVDHISEKLVALENKPDAEYEARCGRAFGHTHNITIERKR